MDPRFWKFFDTDSSFVEDSVGSSMLKLWLDASDISSVVHSSGFVSQWRDKSGNGNHATQGTGANQPVFLTDTINGKSAVSFINVTVPSLNLTSSISETNLTAIAVFVSTETTLTEGTILGHKTINQQLLRFDPDIGANGRLLSYDGTTQAFFSLSASIKDQAVLLMTEFDTSVGQKIYLDGDLKDTESYNGTIQTDVIGLAPGTIHMGGHLGELLVYNRILSSAERNAVESYLSNKWGITLS